MTALDPDVVGEVEASCVCLHVQRAGRTVGRHYDKAFRPLNLTNWQFSLLAAVGGADGPSVNELALLLGMDRTTMTRNLRVLERRGLLTMRPDDQDGRIRRALLTPEGRDLFLKALERWRTVNETMKARITPASLPSVWDAFERIAQP
ncbi:MarR family winged helix-turn-helix transcriptional regulator [Muricoccus pecuniae]|uniref:DNA-binding MarR family transcriptional regulator n=1 Tax=Muricoccus pecuniae TaxID=693023 RepID=A0A840YMF5_9PROT|nr:MarR family winged helix-turn-helix transcriptional regulator [Roseomonas pecuniae]MBB5696542.1 DNA-binding MarR family transcriptional regulator [Roseomonas pecuniae]